MDELGGGFAARTVDAHATLQRLNPLPGGFIVVKAEPTHFLERNSICGAMALISMSIR